MTLASLASDKKPLTTEQPEDFQPTCLVISGAEFLSLLGEKSCLDLGRIV